MRRVGNALTRHKGVGVFGSALLRREGVRGFGFGIGCSGVIQMTRDGRRQVRVGRIGVGTVMVVTACGNSCCRQRQPGVKLGAGGARYDRQPWGWMDMLSKHTSIANHTNIAGNHSNTLYAESTKHPCQAVKMCRTALKS